MPEWRLRRNCLKEEWFRHQCRVDARLELKHMVAWIISHVHDIKHLVPYSKEETVVDRVVPGQSFISPHF